MISITGDQQHCQYFLSAGHYSKHLSIETFHSMILSNTCVQIRRIFIVCTCDTPTSADKNGYSHYQARNHETAKFVNTNPVI